MSYVVSNLLQIFFGGRLLFFVIIGRLETFKWPSNAEEQTTAITAEGTEDWRFSSNMSTSPKGLLTTKPFRVIQSDLFIL